MELNEEEREGERERKEKFILTVIDHVVEVNNKSIEWVCSGPNVQSNNTNAYK